MNVTLSIDEQLLERAREKLRVTGKTVNQEIREHLQFIAGDLNDALERDIQFLEETAGRGNSQGWKFNRDELYERK